MQRFASDYFFASVCSSLVIIALTSLVGAIAAH